MKHGVMKLRLEKENIRRSGLRRNDMIRKSEILVYLVIQIKSANNQVRALTEKAIFIRVRKSVTICFWSFLVFLTLKRLVYEFFIYGGNLKS